MINSCTDCKTKCCKAGPGPYSVVSAYEWLYANHGTRKYNTVCENFDQMLQLCKVWATEKIPRECRTFICSHRVYSIEEIRRIDQELKIAPSRIQKGR